MLKYLTDMFYSDRYETTATLTFINTQTHTCVLAQLLNQTTEASQGAELVTSFVLIAAACKTPTVYHGAFHFAYPVWGSFFAYETKVLAVWHFVFWKRMTAPTYNVKCRA